jgi:hypothetical protein
MATGRRGMRSRHASPLSAAITSGASAGVSFSANDVAGATRGPVVCSTAIARRAPATIINCAIASISVRSFRGLP